MKNIFRYFTALSLSLLVIVSCRDEDAVRFPDLEEGVNARVALAADRAFLDFGDIQNASVAFDIYSQNKNIQKIDYTINYVDVSDPTVKFPSAMITVDGSSFQNGKASVSLTSVQIAEMFGLPGGVSYIGGGDNLVFSTVATLTDGRVFSAANSAPSITGGNNASFTTQFNVLVACAFNVDEAVGTYTITTDEFESSHPEHDLQVEVVPGTAPNTVILKDLFGFTQAYDVVVTVNPANGAAVIAKQNAWDGDFFIPGLGVGQIEGAGFFLSCAGTLTVAVEHTVSAGSYGTFDLQLTKN